MDVPAGVDVSALGPLLRHGEDVVLVSNLLSAVETAQNLTLKRTQIVKGGKTEFDQEMQSKQHSRGQLKAKCIITTFFKRLSSILNLGTAQSIWSTLRRCASSIGRFIATQNDSSTGSVGMVTFKQTVLGPN